MQLKRSVKKSNVKEQSNRLSFLFISRFRLWRYPDFINAPPIRFFYWRTALTGGLPPGLMTSP